MSPPLIVILGAGRPPRGEEPAALTPTPDRRRVLEWILDAFAEIPEGEVHYVGGYGLEEVIRLYPHIRFSVNPLWRSTGSVASLFSAPLEEGRRTYLCYADTVFERQVVARVRDVEAPVVLAVDRDWRDRYRLRTRHDVEIAEKVRLDGDRVESVGTDLAVEETDAEFTGLVRLDPEAVAEVLRLRERSDLSRQGIPALLTELLRAGLPLRAADVRGRWAELNAPQDLARFVMGTKADTLRRLAGVVRHSRISPQVSFTVGQWRGEREQMLSRVGRELGDRAVAVRSSALTEDGWDRSAAGRFVSVLDVPAGDPESLARAVERVIGSYEDGRSAHQVLVQPMVEDVQLSGVALTRTLSSGAPYYTFNYDDSSSRTDSVTGGRGERLTTVVMSRAADDPPDERLRPILAAVRELEYLVGYDALDVEFALEASGVPHVFQLRPIAAVGQPAHASDQRVQLALEQARQRFRELQGPRLHLRGTRTFFGRMPDWNPAEIIGTRPGRLALSLYQNLITDETWARQRAEYGYRDVRPQPLLVAFAGHPYVDVRACFNSFVPAGLEDPLADRLVEQYMERLRTRPELHDKVEFEVVVTCWAFDLERRLEGLGLDGTGRRTVEEALRDITARGMLRLGQDRKGLERLESRYPGLAGAPVPPLERAFYLLEDCRRFGTLTFAHLARGAFVAVTLLRSLVETEALSQEECDDFLNSLSTVARQLELDGAAVHEGRLAWGQFVERYGHLRPGTYDLTSPSYREDPERYLRPAVRPVHHPRTSSSWNEASRRRIGRALERAKLPVDLPAFEDFLRGAIEGRELSKFVFTRNLSRALDCLAEFGEAHGISREALGYLRLSDLTGLLTATPTAALSEQLLRWTEEGRLQHEVCRAVELPALLFEERDLLAFRLLPSQPNFITAGRVLAEVVEVDGAAPERLAGRIALIARADPGYDWLFAHPIRGLITMYGGANSHMAIRSAELGLAAAIGVGEALYRSLSRAEMLELDCGNHRLRIVR
ncbi:MAG: hypothetical protein HY319_21195 [Armatimonadetes bacterium]|nr:hypothetical protein [Armatimonadota bacterium]